MAPSARPSDRALVECSIDDAQTTAPDFSRIPWRRVYCEAPPQLKTSWAILTWQARGLYRLLVTACDHDGVIALGTLGLMAVCGHIGAKRDDWPQVEPTLQELLDMGWLVHDDAGQRLALPWYPQSQQARSVEAQRKQAYRAKRSQIRDCPRNIPQKWRTVPAEPQQEPDCPSTIIREPRQDNPQAMPRGRGTVPANRARAPPF